MYRFVLLSLAAVALLCATAAAQPILDTLTIGTTWYETQHAGSVGRSNTLETSGWRQFVWTKGENQGASTRHVWWNGIDPNGSQVYPGSGVAVDASMRSGFATMDVHSSGAGIITYHANSVGNNLVHPVVSADLIPHGGAFLSFDLPAPVQNENCGWPMAQIGSNGRLHLPSTVQYSQWYTPPTHWYISGVYNPTTFTITFDPAWTYVDTAQVNLVDLATSPVTGAFAAAWARPSSTVGANLYYLIDADGLNPNFANAFNLTQFIPPDPSLFPDTTLANKDTFRLHTDASLLFDNNNYLHIAFTTRPYYHFGHPGGPEPVNASIIWHWSNQYPDSFRIISIVWNPSDSIGCGSGNRIIQKPSLGVAPNGNLYCIFQQFDTDPNHLTDPPDLLPSGEVYASVSTNGGSDWSVAVNITGTITPNHAAAGQCWSEVFPTLAKKIDNYLHIEYVIDKDAGDVIQTQGAWTNNPVRYQRMPVNLIPTTPIVIQNTPFHVNNNPPQLDVSITPINPPIIIPPQGGSFQFTASVVNHGPNQAPFYVWVRIKHPDGSYTPPTMGPVQINPPVGIMISRIRTQNVPGAWNPGQYMLIVYANWTYSYPAVDSAWMYFWRAGASSDNPLITDASCTGEPFPYEIGGTRSVVSASGSRTTPTTVASPNPFNATTAISYELRAASYVTLKVYDASGRLVTILVDGLREVGTHQATFDGSNLASGLYLYRLEVSGSGTTPTTTEGKMVLMK